ncbi:hypothetical protein ACQR0V_05905 [Bradyrhizobium sp. HKCCYLS2058]|uniref:hypothetical protein n=2 Tax=Nitrobacteraceae TaxID=41294 RepID=UPI0039656E65
MTDYERLGAWHARQSSRARSSRLIQEAAMVEKRITASNNVIELANYQRSRADIVVAHALSPRTCRYCGAELDDDEREDDCSSALNVESDRLRWRAAQILRGLVCEG